MKKVLAKSLLVIIETGIEVIADRLKKRRKKDECSDGLVHVRGGCGSHDLRDQSVVHDYPVKKSRKLKRKRRRSISKEGQNT